MFEKEAEDNKPPYAFCSFNTKCELWKSGFCQGAKFGYSKGLAEGRKELEEKISVLLSCKNCPENKGGFICVKEYEGKCLSQKIEFIKELEKEKCELLGVIQGKDKVIQELKKENRVLKCFIKDLIYENHNICSQFSNTTCLFNSDYRNRAEELVGEKLSLGKKLNFQRRLKMTKGELKPIDTSKYKITETGQVLKMTKEECEIETSKAIMEIRTHIAKLEKENAELKEKVSYLEDNLRVARKDRKNLQLKVGKGLKEFIKDCPYSALKLYANGYYIEQLTKAKEIIKDYMIIVKGAHTTVCGVPEENRTIYVLKLNEEAEQFLNKE